MKFVTSGLILGECLHQQQYSSLYKLVLIHQQLQFLIDFCHTPENISLGSNLEGPLDLYVYAQLKHRLNYNRINSMCINTLNNFFVVRHSVELCRLLVHLGLTLEGIHPPCYNNNSSK